MSDRPQPEYTLGHSEQELARLEAQARMVDPMTRRFFVEAGVSAGMRVLDVGSGAGDVAFLAAELVGEKGEVVGVERAPDALATARARASTRSLTNVSFVEGELTTVTFEQSFDAIIGRYVLMFFPDPAAILQRLIPHLRQGGVVVFHEPDWDGARSAPEAPTFDRSCRWLAESLRLRGADPQMAAKLPATFEAAGLPSPAMGLSALVGGGEQSRDCADLVSGLLATMLGEIERLGIASAAEVGVETLADRIVAEAVANGSTLFARAEVGAWTRAG